MTEPLKGPFENSTLSDWTKSVYEYAKMKGWWDEDRSPLEIHMLMVTELAEATEEIRNGKPPVYFNLRPRSLGEPSPGITTDPNDPNHDGKPEGEAVELVDVFIRLCDYFGRKGWNLGEIARMKHLYNVTRPYRHGGKKL
jgi:hypothetical protein